MSKINIPQPVWPELAYFDGETLHRSPADGATASGTAK